MPKKSRMALENIDLYRPYKTSLPTTDFGHTTFLTTEALRTTETTEFSYLSVPSVVLSISVVPNADLDF